MVPNWETSQNKKIHNIQIEEVVPEWLSKYSGFNARRNRLAKAFDKQRPHLFSELNTESKYNIVIFS